MAETTAPMAKSARYSETSTHATLRRGAAASVLPASTSTTRFHAENGLIASNYAIGSPVHHVLPLLNR